jgi:hypothetical protein
MALFIYLRCAMADTSQLSASVSNSLSKCLNKLNLRHNEPNTSPATTHHTPTHNLWSSNGHHIYFGIETTEEWLVQYAKD